MDLRYQTSMGVLRFDFCRFTVIGTVYNIAQVEASMCHLRGVLMLKLNRGDQAKHCFMEALALDVKCYDAFQQLISGEMMTPDEGIFSKLVC